ncbi:TetR/AcrR family transcriptional regulator [Sphingobacterium sp. MYb382]|uniref:TetR/AcrR family transcriptional regulator n=1 Tax=Sphingobacterium sp. MYb382 TaxID=2745278 RepID=UPI00309C724F
MLTKEIKDEEIDFVETKKKASPPTPEIATSQKKEAIFLSTLKLIHEYGFHGTPMSQIALQANVATGTIYHYFTSKDELILELFKYCREKTNEHIFQFDEEASYKERFASVWKRLVHYYVENKEIFRFIEQFYSSPYYELMQQRKDPSYYGVDRMRLFFKEGIDAGIIRDVNFFTLVSIFIGPATSIIKHYKFNQFCKITDQDRDDLIEIIWNGIKNQ